LEEIYYQLSLLLKTLTSPFILGRQTLEAFSNNPQVNALNKTLSYGEQDIRDLWLFLSL
jgi:hypothetical protein